MEKKQFNKKFLILIPIILIVVIYNLFFKNKDFLYAGTIEATKIDISARVSSVISDFPAHEGQYIKKDELLVELTCEDIRNTFDMTQKDFERAEKLYKTGSLSKENFDHAVSKANEAKIKKNWCTVTSNIDAKVLNVYREPGEYVVPGTKLATLADLSEVWTVIYVPQDIHSKLKTEMKVVGYLPELGMKSFEGTISHISDVAEFTPKNVQTREERTRLIYGVKVKFKNPDEILKPGMSIEVKLEN